MSEKQSGPAPSDTRAVTVPQSASDDPPILPDGATVLEKVQEDLVKGGVRREQAPKLAHQVVEYVASYHSGPLPSVRDFAGSDQICPGAARDILDMAKSEQRHHERMEVGQLRGEIFLKSLAMFTAVGIICVMTIGALYAAASGHEGLGITIASGSGLALVAGVVAKIFLGKPPRPPQPPQPSKQNRKKR